MTLQEKLNQISALKNLIKAKVIAQGTSVLDDDTAYNELVAGVTSSYFASPTHSFTGATFTDDFTNPTILIGGVQPADELLTVKIDDVQVGTITSTEAMTETLTYSLASFVDNLGTSGTITITDTAGNSVSVSYSHTKTHTYYTDVTAWATDNVLTISYTEVTGEVEGTFSTNYEDQYVLTEDINLEITYSYDAYGHTTTYIASISYVAPEETTYHLDDVKYDYGNTNELTIWGEEPAGEELTMYVNGNNVGSMAPNVAITTWGQSFGPYIFDLFETTGENTLKITDTHGNEVSTTYTVEETTEEPEETTESYYNLVYAESNSAPKIYFGNLTTGTDTNMPTEAVTFTVDIDDIDVGTLSSTYSEGGYTYGDYMYNSRINLKSVESYLGESGTITLTDTDNNVSYVTYEHNTHYLTSVSYDNYTGCIGIVGREYLDDELTIYVNDDAKSTITWTSDTYAFDSSWLSTGENTIKITDNYGNEVSTTYTSE